MSGKPGEVVAKITTDCGEWWVKSEIKMHTLYPSPPTTHVWVLHFRPSLTRQLQRHDDSLRVEAPPQGRLIDWTIPPEHAEDRVLQLLRGYERWVGKYGERTARRMFLIHSVGAVIEFWTDWLLKRLKLLDLLRRG